MKSRLFTLLSVFSFTWLLLWSGGCRSNDIASVPKVPFYRLIVDLDDERLASITYTHDIKPILDARCISCHACYDAPGQLKLNSADGLRRGASKDRVYGVKVKDRPTTRLYVDAVSEEGWRDLGFFQVLGDPEAETPQERLDSSVFYQMLALARLRRLPEEGLLDGIVRDSHDVAQAPTIEEFPEYAAKFPHAGMPFYTYGLTEDEFMTFAHWIGAGAPIDDEDLSLTPVQAERIGGWEELLNREGIRNQTIARYLFEHWFAASLYVDDGPGRPDFFKIVRSSTPPGQPVEVIPTRRPNDPPGVDRVFYRIVKRPNTILRKNHLPYALTPDRMQRILDLFYQSDWTIDALPGYGPEESNRPLELFAAIPESIRYRFMLDDALYYVQAYIRGPVCRGQAALSVIWDHFFVYFMDPSADPSVSDPDFAARTREQLRMPAAVNSIGDFLIDYPGAKRGIKAYWDERYKHFRTQAPLGPDAVWQGGRDTDVPFMTVFRHFDTATVEPGFLGETPEFAWYVDFDLFERIYYLLVVNFDVFGSAGHQVATRQYFDLLRYEGEMNFLRLFPEDQRQAMYDRWYQGVSGVRKRSTYPLPDFGIGTGFDFPADQDPRDALRRQLVAASGIRNTRHPESASVDPLVDTYLQVNQQLAPHIQYFPEVTFLRVLREGREDEVYTLFRNKAHRNVAYIFGEAKQRMPEHDTLTMVPGLVGDYPNFMMVLTEEELKAFGEDLKKVDSIDRMFSTWLSYGVLRNSPDFWPALDGFTEWDLTHNPIQGARFDLKHYFLTRMLMLEQADLVPGPDLSNL